jgi:hypothetical protein
MVSVLTFWANYIGVNFTYVTNSRDVVQSGIEHQPNGIQPASFEFDASHRAAGARPVFPGRTISIPRRDLAPKEGKHNPE